MHVCMYSFLFSYQNLSGIGRSRIIYNYKCIECKMWLGYQTGYLFL